MPPSNAYKKTQDQKELVFPLHAYVCHNCFLVQLGQFQTPDEIFSEYQYFSSYSKSWVKHAHDYVKNAISRFSLTQKSLVVEIASNDGYLLQHFLQEKIPHLGIEPAKNVASIAREKGIPTISAFFGTKLATQLHEQGLKPNLIIGNNVLAHVPDLNDFIAGLKILLDPSGIITLEFPHLLQLIANNQFDTIYHEHFSYFSLFAVEKIFSHHELEIFDVDEIPTHGGSLRIYLQHKNGSHSLKPKVEKIKNTELNFGLKKIETYQTFYSQVENLKTTLVNLLHDFQIKGKKIAGYGAPAKGNTLLNYCEITPNLLPFTVDISPHKQGWFLPGSRIPILHPSEIENYKPEYLLILPWNLKDEIIEQMRLIRKWGGNFIIPVPLTII